MMNLLTLVPSDLSTASELKLCALLEAWSGAGHSHTVCVVQPATFDRDALLDDILQAQPDMVVLVGLEAADPVGLGNVIRVVTCVSCSNAG